MSIDKKRLLIIYSHAESPENIRLTIKKHYRVMEYSDVKHNITYFNAFTFAPSNSWASDDPPPQIPKEIEETQFDVVLLFDTFLDYRYAPTSYFLKIKQSFNWIGSMDCIKIALPQDEYDHNEILDEWLFDWDISIIFSNYDESRWRILYPIMHSKADFYKCFTGYIDDSQFASYAEKIQPMEKRPFDIVYRASKLPYWFGSHGQLKYEISEIVAKRAKQYGLYCNISTHIKDTILGNKWLDFLASGKSVIGCESGSSVIDRRGEIKTQIQNLLNKNSRLSFKELSNYMPAGWDDFHPFAISPRHFEAITTKTCQILMEGYYDGVLIPDKHYIPIKRDFSNLDEALIKIKVASYVQKIADQAYLDIGLSGLYSYKVFAKLIEQAIFKHENNNVSKSQNIIELETLERQLVRARHLRGYWLAKMEWIKEYQIRRYLKIALVLLAALLLMTFFNLVLVILMSLL